MKKYIKYILFSLILAVLLMPMLQKRFHIFELKPLYGDFTLEEKPAFSWEKWMEGSFQDEYDRYLEDHIGFRNFFVRLNNQIHFKLFNIIFAEGVIQGKDGQLFEEDYIRSFTGRDYVGKDIIDKNIRRFKFLQDTLKNKFNTDLILVFEPGKAFYYQEHIPDNYLNQKKKHSNYLAYKKKADSLNILHIDLNHYYAVLKDTIKYPLFTKNGTHWSEYGARLMADTLVKYIENVRSVDLPEIYTDSIWISTSPWGTDNDISMTMNLLWDPPMEPMKYSLLKFGDTTAKQKPRVLVVGDSYYWNIYNTKLPENLFRDHAFWYFNAKVYSKKYGYGIEKSKINAQKDIEQSDVILLMLTERFMYKFDWGFTDELYKMYGPYSEIDLIHTNIVKILRDDNWFDNLLAESEKKGEPLSLMLRKNAKELLKRYHKTSHLRIYGPEIYKDNIQSDSVWRNAVKAKALKYGISYEKMKAIDADYVFRSEHPDIYKEYIFVNNFISGYYEDSLKLNALKRKAKSLFLKPEELLKYYAEQQFNKAD